MMQPNLNLVPSTEISLADAFSYLKRDLKLEINCHHIGTINSFNSSLQTAQVTINYVKTFIDKDALGQTVNRTQNYPTIIDAPCIFPGGGNANLTFPVQKGDPCFVLFNDRDLDNWFAGSSSSSPSTPRLHSFSDAVVLVGGPRSILNVILNYDASAAALSNGTTSVKVYSDKVVITIGLATVTVTASDVLVNLGAGVTLELTSAGKFKVTNSMGELVSAILQLMTDVQNGLVTTMLGPNPLVMPTFATDLQILQSFKG